MEMIGLAYGLFAFSHVPFRNCSRLSPLGLLARFGMALIYVPVFFQVYQCCTSDLQHSQYRPRYHIEVSLPQLHLLPRDQNLSLGKITINGVLERHLHNKSNVSNCYKSYTYWNTPSIFSTKFWHGTVKISSTDKPGRFIYVLFNSLLF